MIEGYYQSLLALIATSPIVRASEVTLDQRGPREGLVRGDLYFGDGSRLHFRELVTAQQAIMRVMYSYHYQQADDGLVFRYDDTAHYPNLPNFPHHKHIGDEAQVISTIPPDLATVLHEIADRLAAQM